MLTNRYRVKYHDTGSNYEHDYGAIFADSADDAIELTLRQTIESGDQDVMDNLRKHITATEMELHTTGEYIGNDPNFVGQRAHLKFLNSQPLCQAQFNSGPKWATHSWLTFDRDDWNIEGEAKKRSPYERRQPNGGFVFVGGIADGQRYCVDELTLGSPIHIRKEKPFDLNKRPYDHVLTPSFDDVQSYQPVEVVKGYYVYVWSQLSNEQAFLQLVEAYAHE